MHKRIFSVYFVLTLMITAPLLAQPPHRGDSKDKASSSEKMKKPVEIQDEKTSVTNHVATIGGKKIEYEATAGTLHLKNDDGKAIAGIFYIAYKRKGMDNMAKRPITFSFNGGPGSSSVWLHLGVLGPLRVHMDEDGNPYPPPYQLVNNESSLLDETDLVFIDPVGTGYSRSAPDEKASQFHGLEEDVESVGEFIRLYLTRNERWSSPKFIIGESYGTTRATGLSQYLQGRHGIYLNGVMLVSSILNFQTARFDLGNDLPYILFLPTYTATAWYHKKLDEELMGDLEATVQKARDFALGEYATALVKGDAMSDSERKAMVNKVAYFTGLKPEYVDSVNLRVRIYDFVDELLRDDYRRVGRLDSRFKGINRNDGGFSFGSDPSYAAIQGPYTATLNHLVRETFKFESDLIYEILGGRIGRWNYDGFTNRYVNVAPRLKTALEQNPNLKIFVANGYYDLATPFFATEYTFNHMNLDPELRDNITMSYYESGHMMYIHLPSLARMKTELTQFMKSAMPN